MNPVALVMPSAGICDAEATMGDAMGLGGVPAFPIIAPDPDLTGFTATVNRGLAQVPEGCDVMIINDDVEQFYLGWLKDLQEGLYSHPRIGLIGPSGDCSTSPMKDYPTGAPGLQSVGWFPFWCALIRWEAFLEVGHLDPAFIHYASDYAYCDRLREAGWAVAWLRSAVLKHTSAGSGKRAAWAGHDLSLYKHRMDRKKKRGEWVETVSLS